MPVEEVVDVKLKACPFCGEPAVMRSYNGGYSQFFWAKCQNFDCRVTTMAQDDPDKAANLWNQRA